MSVWRSVSIDGIAATDRYSVVGGPFGSALGRKDYVPEGVPVIRGAQLGGLGAFSHDDLVFVTDKKADSHQGNLAYPGDVLVTQRGTVGQVGRIPEEAPYSRYLLSQSQMKLTVDPSVADARFIYYALLGPQAQQTLYGSTVTAGVPHINLATFRGLVLDLPSLDDQSRIAGVLTTLDGLIENNRRRIELLERMAQAIYWEWFVRFRYPGHEDATFVGSSLGPIPEGWAVRPLVSVASLTMGQSPPSEHFNTEGIGKPFHQGVTDFGQHFPIHRKFCSVDGRSAMTGDILISVRAPVGRLNITPDDIAIGRGVAAARSVSGRQALLFRALKGGVFAEEDSMGGGTIFKAIGKQELEQVGVLVAPDGIECLAEDVLGGNAALLKALTFRNRSLMMIRDLLLPKLVTGQIDVAALDLDAVVGSVA